MLTQTPFYSLSLFEIIFFGALFGLIIGSFLSMLSWRLPRLLMAQYAYDVEQEFNLQSQETPANAQTESKTHDAFYNPHQSILSQLSVGGSKCPKCHTRLKWYQLFPVFSWLASKGKCLHCKTPISIRYPAIELFSALSTVLILWQFGLSPVGIAALIFNYLLITICVIDFEHHLILDLMNYPLLWLGLLINTQGVFTSLESAVWGAALGYLLLWVVYHSFKFVTGKEGMGYGDFKMLAALGAWFGLSALPQIILVAALASIAFGLIGMALKVRNYEQPLAFGPFLALGGWATLFLGAQFI